MNNRLESLATEFLKDSGFNQNGVPLGDVDEIQEAFEEQLAEIRDEGKPVSDDHLRRVVDRETIS
jgi:hypothetical protein